MPLLNLVKLPITTIALSPGSHLLINDVTWEQYETLLADLGEERRIPRINYCNGTLELMSPLPAHERPHRIIAYIVTNILIRGICSKAPYFSEYLPPNPAQIPR